MKQGLLIYALVMALLIWVLKVLNYRFMVHDFTWEVYLSIIAVLFAALGIWVGRKLTYKKSIDPIPPYPQVDRKVVEGKRKEIGLSEREFEVLELMAEGHSNQDIADKLFISLNTVKSHASHIYQKLEVQRRTQAIQQAKERGLLF